MSHTPLPWRLDGDEIVSDATGEMLADFYDMHHGTGELGTDNAALAVRAVNCHDDLVAALRSVIDWFEWLQRDQYEHLTVGQSLETASLEVSFRNYGGGDKRLVLIEWAR